jgi:hypothetical protein
MSMRIILVAAVLLPALACTGGGTTSTPPDATPSASTSNLPRHVTVGGETFDVSCTPVAEALVDITLPHVPGQPMIRAITGLWDRQAVAVLANDRTGCGMWALGLARGLSPAAMDAIRSEVADGVEHFGVTASPVPRDTGGG